jgi:co-chaperonin GroES (HSP10)
MSVETLKAVAKQQAKDGMSESHADANFEEYDMPTGLGQIVKDGEVAETYNHSGIVPTEYKLLVLPDDVPNMTSGGIHVPPWVRDQRQAASVTGTIISMADEAFSFVQPKPEPDTEDGLWPRVPVVGERVAFARYAGMAVRGKDRVDYRLMNDKDVAAILDFAFDPEAYQF